MYLRSISSILMADPELHFQLVRVILAAYRGLLLILNQTFKHLSFNIYWLLTDCGNYGGTETRNYTKYEVGLAVPKTTVEMAPLCHYNILLSSKISFIFTIIIYNIWFTIFNFDILTADLKSATQKTPVLYSPFWNLTFWRRIRNQRPQKPLNTSNDEICFDRM